MHPAFSVLIFTVTSGAGYGLMSLLILGHLSGMSLLQESTTLLVGGILAVILVTGGLLSSTLHLANPKNAWRAFGRFKTSWLSREAVFAVLFYPAALTYLGAIWTEGSGSGEAPALTGQLSAIATLLLSLFTLFSTSMIYASLKTIRQWNTSLTPLNYLVLGFMSGALLLVAIDTLVTGSMAESLQSLALLLVLLGAISKLIYLFWIGKPAGSTINTATGFTQAKVRLLDAGHTADTFLNNEFGYEAGADKLLRLRFVMVVLAFIVPFVLLTLNLAALAVLAAFIALAGLLVERWLFFAEARHVVRLFHGDQTT